MNLAAALKMIARVTQLSSAKLIRYAKEYDGDNERKVLYAVVRTLKPTQCLEIGTSHGDGTMCIAAALEANSLGWVTTVDINPDVGQHFKPELMHRVIEFTADANTWIEDKCCVDFVFEDGNHSAYQVHQVYKHLDTLLRPGGIIISHDAAIDGVKDYIRQGQTSAGYDLPVFVVDPLPYGYSIYRKAQNESTRDI